MLRDLWKEYDMETTNVAFPSGSVRASGLAVDFVQEMLSDSLSGRQIKMPKKQCADHLGGYVIRTRMGLAENEGDSLLLGIKQ